MFNILHGDQPTKIAPAQRRSVDPSFRRRRTDICSVEALNYCKKSIFTNTEYSPMSLPKCSKPKAKLVTPGHAINVNVRVLHDECDCTSRKKRDAAEKHADASDCQCKWKKKKTTIVEPVRQALEEGIEHKAITTVDAAAPGATVRIQAKPGRQPSSTRELTIAGRSKSNPQGFDWKSLYNFGEKGSGFSSKSGAQDFYKIRDRCLNTGTLFEDPEFPPTNVSLFNSAYGDRRFLWKRPGEIVKNPKLFVEGFSRFDVQQGELGDCWLLAATANLTLYKRLFFQIVPDDQEFDGKYAGIFHFRFWQYGRWVDVVVDDKLPTEKGELVYLHSTEKNEFWSALLEKAYAKLHGSYEALKGGSTCEAMEDFTGGVTEMYELNSAPPNLFKILQKAYERSSLLGCSIEPDPKKFEAQTPQGLVRGHAYSITKVKFLDIKTPNMTGKIPLLRLRNPWGNETEWNGAWSDNSPEWKYISEAEKKDLGLIFDDDGEFWMSFKDFQTHFDRLEICNLNPDSLSTIELHGKKKWEMSMFEGAWVRGITAGGCRNFLETFGNNPQYRITLTDVDEDDEENKCTLIIALMQKNRRILKASSGAELLTMGFAIYYLPRPDKVPTPLDYNFFKFNASVGRSPTFVNLREVSCRFKFPKGTYCIVPSTYEPNQEGDFLVRVFSEKRSNMAEHDQKIGYRAVDERVGGPTQVKQVHAEIQKGKIAGPPTEEDLASANEACQIFTKVAGDVGEIDYLNLKQILDVSFEAILKGNHFSKDSCRSMVAMLDEDYSGKLGLEEFKELWQCINLWEKAFVLYDIDNSGTLSGFELRNVLNAAGYELNNHVLNILMFRYGDDNRELPFDKFIMCAVKLKSMIDKFQQKTEDQESVTLSREEWVAITLYC